MSKGSKYCEGCAYRKVFTAGSLPYCDYFLMTNKRRPCPGGDGCTVRITKREYQEQRLTDAEKAFREIKRKEKEQAYYQRNKEKILARNRKWRQENKEHRAQYWREYRKRKKEE